MESIKIDNQMLSMVDRPYVIAEIGANHNGDMDLCRKIIDAAIESGASAVKFQSWTPSSLISKQEYARNTAYSDTKKHFGSLEDMINKYTLTESQHRDISEYCHHRKITFLSSAFSPNEVALLESINVPMHKVASMDINNMVLLQSVADTRKPVILSTGMSTISEIEYAVNILEKRLSGPIILLHCVSLYPPQYEDINLRNIETLQKAFGKLVGFSDHTIGSSIPLAAIALGAVVIEKHFTLDKDMSGWDHLISADPQELKTIVTEGNNIFQSLGSYRRTVTALEMEKRKQFRRSVVVRGGIKKGEKITLENIDFKRPGHGISPVELPYLLKKRAALDLVDDSELSWDDLSD